MGGSSIFARPLERIVPPKFVLRPSGFVLWASSFFVLPRSCSVPRLSKIQFEFSSSFRASGVRGVGRGGAKEEVWGGESRGSHALGSAGVSQSFATLSHLKPIRRSPGHPVLGSHTGFPEDPICPPAPPPNYEIRGSRKKNSIWIPK